MLFETNELVIYVCFQICIIIDAHCKTTSETCETLANVRSIWCSFRVYFGTFISTLEIKHFASCKETSMLDVRRPWASKDIHELGSSRWHHNLMDRDKDADLPPAPPSSEKNVLLPYSLLTMMTKCVAILWFSHYWWFKHFPHFVLFSLHISSMWETIYDVVASWSGWKFG